MLAVFSIIFAGVTFTVGIFSYFIASEVISKKVSEANLDALRQIQISIDNTMEKIDMLTMNLSTNYMLKKDFEDLEVEEKTSMIMNFFPQFSLQDYIDSVYIYYQKSRKIMSSNSIIVGIDFFKDTGWVKDYEIASPLGFKTLIINERVIQKDAAGETVLTMIRDFPIRTMPKTGSLIININKKKLFSSIEQIDREDQKLFIVDKQNQLVYGNKQYFEELKLEKDYKSFLEKSDQDNQTKIENNSKMLILVNSTRNGWKYIKVLEMESLASDTQKIKRFTVWLIFFSLFVGIVIWVIVSLGFYNPIVYLMEKVGGNQRGDELVAKNEMDLLNNMVDTIIVNKQGIEELYKKSQNDIINGLMVSLCNGDISDEPYIKQQLEAISFPIEMRSFVVMIIKIDDYVNFIKKHSHNEVVNIKKKFREIVTHICNDKIGMISTSFEDDRFISLISLAQNYDERMILENAHAMQKILKEDLMVCVTIGIGNMYRDIREISISYREAIDALSFKVFNGIGTIIHINDYNVNGENPKYYFPISKEIEFMDAIKVGNKKRALDVIEDIYSGIPYSPVMVNYVSELLWQLVNGIFLSMNSMGLKYEEVFGKSFFESYQEYSTKESIDEMIEYIKSQVIKITDHIDKRRGNKNETIMEGIKKHIDLHYQDNLSLNDFSSMFYMSPSYISTLFKEATGEGFSDYLRRIRMEKAKELLVTTNKNLDKIIADVGYESLRSFVRAFKNYAGLTPSEYRKKNAAASILAENDCEDETDPYS